MARPQQSEHDHINTRTTGGSAEMTQEYTGIPMNNVKILLPSCTKAKVPQSSFRLPQFYSPRMTASLSITSALVWLADGWKDGGWRVGGWAIMGLCVTVRACSQHYLSSQQIRWERQVRRGWALFKSLFKVPTEPTFPNGASQARHPMLVLAIPMPYVLICCHCFNSCHSQSRRQYRYYNT